jgi:hypothetical protein
MSTTFTEENNMEVEYGSLKTLTVLTFIGSALGYIFSIWGYLKADKNVTDMETAMNQPNLPDFAKKFLTPEALENARLMAANKLPLLLCNLIATTLCLVGAIQMRKLKQQGYYLWLIGEIFPLIVIAVFVNVASLYSGFAIMTPIFILVFIILYTTQRKYLINK